MKIQSIFQIPLRTTQQLEFIPFLNGLRFLAILLLILLQASDLLIQLVPTNQLFPGIEFLSFLVGRESVGYSVFFAVSGFALSIPFAKSRPRASYREYLKRKLYRIIPPFFLVVSGLAGLLLIRGEYSESDLVGHYLATITFTHELFYGDHSVIFPLAWTLGVQVQFYLVLPLLTAGYFGIRSTAERRMVLMWTVFSLILFQHGVGWNLYPFKATLLGQIPHFLVGMLVADLYQKPIKALQKSHVWDVIFPVLLLILAFTDNEQLAKSLIFEIAVLLIFLSVIYSKVIHRIVSFLGDFVFGAMSFSLYLIHLPILRALALITVQAVQWTGIVGLLSILVLVGIPLTLLCGLIVYRWIERPFMHGQQGRQASSYLVMVGTIPRR